MPVTVRRGPDPDSVAFLPTIPGQGGPLHPPLHRSKPRSSARPIGRQMASKDTNPFASLSARTSLNRVSLRAAPERQSRVVVLQLTEPVNARSCPRAKFGFTCILCPSPLSVSFRYLLSVQAE